MRQAEMIAAQGLSWFGIIRLGTVQAAIGAMVMLATSLLNRVMIVEYGVAAAIPAALVGWHYAVQLSRPLWGHRSDTARQRTPWIVMGMGVLALGLLMAVDATVWMGEGRVWPILLAIAAFTLIGLGVGMSGTALLALLASRVAPTRKPAAAAISWTMMVAGIVVAAGVSGSFLDPFSAARLAIVASFVVLGAFSLAMLALHRLELRSLPVTARRSDQAAQSFGETLRDIWADAQARRFTGFVFLSMVAYSMQDLILEPFAGLVFGYSAGQSTKLAGVQHSGILLGMIVAGIGGTLHARRFGQNVKLWIVIGCCGSAIMLAGLAAGALTGGDWPLKANIFGLGLANGVFAVAAVGAMLGLASDGRHSGEGARMGVWGAAQAVAFGCGGLAGAMIVDLLRAGTSGDGAAFATAFCIEAAMFLIAALFAGGTAMQRSTRTRRMAQA